MRSTPPVARPSWLGRDCRAAESRNPPQSRRYAHLVTSQPWPAPAATGSLVASVTLPGSKSMTNRALILAALADGSSRIARPLRARDTLLMVGALRSLGIDICEYADGWEIHPRSMKGPAEVDCGLAGTVMRFVPPVAGLVDGEVRFDGDRQMRDRPVGALLGALRVLGARVEHLREPRLPFTVHGTGRMAGGSVVVDASASSQFVSGLLLAGPRYDSGVDIRHEGKPVPSMPHIHLTVELLRDRGVDVHAGKPNRWVVSPGRIKAVDMVIEPDLSSAAPFLAAALVTRGTVTVHNWLRETQQPGAALPSLLALMGAEHAFVADGLMVTSNGPIDPVDVDLHDVGELAPVIAALCALASGPSHLRGIAHLRGHETDRIQALATELNRLGGDVRETPDGLDIHPRPLHPATFCTYHDHRMAHAAVVLGLAIPGLLVDNVATTSKTFVDFPGVWNTFVR
jgi:3-phosphoshikimate 1-carboxyvinyltransferase